jgi:hypothetical protein
MSQIQIVALAIRTLFERKKIILHFVILTFLVLWLFIYIPVKKIPGNSFIFQISLFGFSDWFLLVVLSILTSITFLMNIFVINREIKQTLNAASLGRGGVGAVFGVLGSIFGPTASCASCVSSIFGFLGIGGVLFLLKYRQVIVALSILIMLFTLYHTSKRVLGICKIKTTRR